MKTIKPLHTSVFGFIWRYGSREHLTGLDEKGRFALIGGKVEDHENDLYAQAFEREFGQEANGTVNPINFGQSGYNLNCVLAHHKPLMFCTDPKTHKRVDPRKHQGAFNFRVIFPLYEISGNTPQDVTELTDLAYRDLSHKSQEDMRGAVRIALQERRLRWINDCKEPSVKKPLRPNLYEINKYMRANGFAESYINRFIPEYVRHIAA